MTVYSQVRKFSVLDKDVDSNVQVFDKLVKVKCLLTEAEGYLLCSHSSKWPNHLIENATWLAGCFTPESFKDDSRLVFGNIPNNTINWVVDKESSSITLITGNVEHNNFEELGVELIELVLPWQITDKIATKKVVNKIKALDRAMFRNQDVAPYLKIQRLSQFMLNSSYYSQAEWAYIQQTICPELQVEYEYDSQSITLLGLAYNDGYQISWEFDSQKTVNDQLIKFSFENEELTQSTEAAYICSLPYINRYEQWVVDPIGNVTRSSSNERENRQLFGTKEEAVQWSIDTNKYFVDKL